MKIGITLAATIMATMALWIPLVAKEKEREGEADWQSASFHHITPLANSWWTNWKAQMICQPHWKSAGMSYFWKAIHFDRPTISRGSSAYMSAVWVCACVYWWQGHTHAAMFEWNDRLRARQQLKRESCSTLKWNEVAMEHKLMVRKQKEEGKKRILHSNMNMNPVLRI